MGLLSAAIVCAGLILLIFGITAKKQAMQTDISNTPEDKPWLARKDWAGGRIATSTRKAVVLLWVIVIFWCLASTVLTLVVVPPQLRRGQSRRAFCPDLSPAHRPGQRGFRAKYHPGVEQVWPQCFSNGCHARRRWRHPRRRDSRGPGKLRPSMAGTSACVASAAPLPALPTTARPAKKSSGRMKNGCVRICPPPAQIPPTSPFSSNCRTNSRTRRLPWAMAFIGNLKPMRSCAGRIFRPLSTCRYSNCPRHPRRSG